MTITWPLFRTNTALPPLVLHESSVHYAFLRKVRDTEAVLSDSRELRVNWAQPLRHVLPFFAVDMSYYSPATLYISPCNWSQIIIYLILRLLTFTNRKRLAYLYGNRSVKTRSDRFCEELKSERKKASIFVSRPCSLDAINHSTAACGASVRAEHRGCFSIITEPALRAVSFGRLYLAALEYWSEI